MPSKASTKYLLTRRTRPSYPTEDTREAKAIQNRLKLVKKKRKKKVSGTKRAH